MVGYKFLMELIQFLDLIVLGGWSIIGNFFYLECILSCGYEVFETRDFLVKLDLLFH